MYRLKYTVSVNCRCHLNIRSSYRIADDDEATSNTPILAMATRSTTTVFFGEFYSQDVRRTMRPDHHSSLFTVDGWPQPTSNVIRISISGTDRSLVPWLDRFDQSNTQSTQERLSFRRQYSIYLRLNYQIDMYVRWQFKTDQFTYLITCVLHEFSFFLSLSTTLSHAAMTSRWR